MTDHPLISVIIPAFNVAEFVRDAVMSVLNQTWHHLELIAVDDGSTDSTLEVLRSIDDSRLRVLSQNNRGSSAARNTGVEASHGDLIAFLDGDDLWSRSKLEEQVRILRTFPNLDLVFCRSRIINEAGHDTRRRSIAVAGSVSLRDLMRENVVNNGSAVLLRRTALEQVGLFDVNLPSCVDYDMWLRIASLRNENIYCIPNCLTDYRMRKGQITKSWRRMESGWLAVIQKLKLLSPQAVRVLEPEMRGRMYRYLSYIAYENRQFDDSKALFRKALRASGLKLFGDRRVAILALALFFQAILPTSIHDRFERSVRRLRAL